MFYPDARTILRAHPRRPDRIMLEVIVHDEGGGLKPGVTIGPGRRGSTWYVRYAIPGPALRAASSDFLSAAGPRIIARCLRSVAEKVGVAMELLPAVSGADLTGVGPAALEELSREPASR